MPRIFFGNFDFEHELAAAKLSRPPNGTRSAQVKQAVPVQQSAAFRQRLREIPPRLAAAWVAIAEPDDLILAPEPVDPTSLDDLALSGIPLPNFVSSRERINQLANGELVPWGWTPSMLALAEHFGLTHSAPPLEIVRQVNSRAFRCELENKFGVALPGSALARSVDEVSRLVAASGDMTNGWILKSNFGMAGRESIRGRGVDLSESILNWACARIASVGVVVFEPLVLPIAEAGIQMHISSNGAPELIGVTPLLTDRSGTYRGSRFGSHAVDVAPWQAAIEVAVRVAARLQQLGYFGPLGIDAMQYRDANGEPRLRPLQDLNARYTMGRLALGFQRILPPNWCATWLHLPRRAVGQTERAAGLIPAECTSTASSRFIATSPASILVLADSPERRAEIEALEFRLQPVSQQRED